MILKWKKVWQFNNPQAGFCSKYGGLPRIFLFWICFINITIGAFKNQSYLLTRCQLLLAVTPDSRLKYQSSEQLGQTLHQILTPNPDQVTMSYLEIYNENIRDLLDPASGYLELRDESGGRNIQVILLTLKIFKICKKYGECVQYLHMICQTIS